MIRALLVVAVAACRPAPPALDSCADELGGVWRVDDVAAAVTPSGEPRRYHVVELGARVEIYPMFDDSVVAPGDRKETTPDAVIAAPATFELSRAGDALYGAQTRRFARGAATCLVHTPARLTACHDRSARLELTPIDPPVDWTTCAPGRQRGAAWTITRERD